MKYSKDITINIGNYENVKLGVSDCESFRQCDEVLLKELSFLGLKSRAIRE